MRIVILSIALLFCAFTAHSQVLKSAGVWYFLDVDSMTARPAVLPNGTELAYVVGTKTVYYWNRNTSTWTAYGSTFNRDSIYFDASIVGSGTLGDPWRVDSTLFATIAGVGDSIANALLGYLPIEGGTLTGTGGAGFIGFPSQVSAPGTPTSGLNVYAQGSSFNWKGTDGYERQFASTLTGGRTYTLPNVSGTFALGTGTATRIPIWTNTNTLGDSPILYNSTTKRTTWDSPGVIELPMGTDAQRPSPATTSDFWYNTTGNGIEWYNGTRWAKGAEFTFNRGTAGYLPFPNANGQYTESANLTYLSNILRLTSSPDYIEINPSLSGAPNILLFNSGQAAINLSAVNDATVGAALNVTGGIKASGPISTPSVFRAAALSSQTDPNLAFPVQNGSLVLRTTSGINPFINFFEATIAVKGNIGMTTGNPGDLVFETSPSNTNTFLSGTQRFRVQGSTGRFGIGTGSTINYSLEQLGQTDAFGVARGTVAQRPTIASNTTPIRFSTDSIALEYGESVGTWRQLATRAYARSLVSSLPTTWLKTEMEAGRDVNIKTAKHLYLKTTGGATGTDIYTGGSTYLKTATGDFGGALFLADTTGNLDFAYGWQQDDRTVIQNGGLGRQVTNLLTDYNPTVTFRWVSGVRLDTTTSIHTMRIMWGDKSTNEIYPTEFIFNAASSPNTAATVAAYNFKTAHNIGRLSLNFDNGIYLKKDRKFFLESDSTFSYSFTDNVLRLSQYGTGTKTAAATGKTPSNYVAGFATDGTVTDLEQKRDTTVYVVDTDLDWSAAITTAQISRRYNRVIFLMTTTAAAGSDSDLTLHTPDVNLMQVEYLIRSTDEAGGFSNKIVFGSNNAVDSTNGLVTNYFPSAGQGVGIRAGLRSGVYKYYYY